MALIHKLRDKSRQLAAAITTYATNSYIEHPTPKSLPPELWLLVFELVIEAYCSPSMPCDYLTFLRIRGYLHLPSMYPPIDEQCCKLRLVCRAFAELLRRYQLVFVMKDDGKGLPPSSKAVYISLYQDGTSSFERIVEEPTRSRRIIAMDVPFKLRHQIYSAQSTGYAKPMSFDLLCANATALRGMRHLTLDTRCVSSKLSSSFWRSLNRAFPELTSLVLRGHNLDSIEDSGTITFTRVEILDLGSAFSPGMLRFPVLRHFACRMPSENNMAIISTAPVVESIIFRWSAWSLRRIPGYPFKPESLLLGLPVALLHNFSNQAPSNPVLHLCIYLETRLKDQRPKAEELIKRAVERLSTVTYFTFDFTKVANWQESRIDKCLSGLHFETLGLVEVPFLRGALCRTFERVQTGPQASSHFSGVQHRWKSLHQFTSRTLRILS
jgi:hypothetical protein